MEPLRGPGAGERCGFVGALLSETRVSKDAFEAEETATTAIFLPQMHDGHEWTCRTEVDGLRRV